MTSERQEALFDEFILERHVRDNHLLRTIGHLDLSDRAKLEVSKLHAET